MPNNLNAERFVEELEAHCSSEQREKYQRYFKLGEGEYCEGGVFIGVRVGQVFALAKNYIEIEPEEIEKLLESEVHEGRGFDRRTAPRSEPGAVRLGRPALPESRQEEESGVRVQQNVQTRRCEAPLPDRATKAQAHLNPSLHLSDDAAMPGGAVH